MIAELTLTLAMWKERFRPIWVEVYEVTGLVQTYWSFLINESMNATWDIALEHCPPDGDLNGFYQALRDSLTDAFQKIDLEEFTVDPPPDWAIGFIHKYNFENEL